MKSLVIAVAVYATATIVNVLLVPLDAVAVALGIVAAVVLGLGVGLALRSNAAAAAGSTDKGVPAVEEAFVRFAYELVGVTTTDRLRRVLAAHLPALIGTPHVWIAARTARGRHVIVPEHPSGTTPEDLLAADSREWTTFALRAGDDDVGVLGVESHGGLTEARRRAVQRVAPIIAQAIATAHAIDAIREKGLVDPLTGLANRHEGMSRLESEIKRAQRAGTTLAVLMLDLDQFKSINDRYGHAVGDAVLSAVGRTMMRTLRASDIRARWGGEEFLVVLPETDLARARIVASGLLREIGASTVATPAGDVASSISIGITISQPGETDAAAMLGRADMALYEAKGAGRACVRVVMADRHGNPVAVAPGPSPGAGTATMLPFPDRRNPQRGDRRRVPSPGRRSTDPRPAVMGESSKPAGREFPQVRSSRR